MSSESHVLELLPAYALGCLDEDELIFVSEHLAGCPLCQAELQTYQLTVDQLALTVPAVAPPPDLKRRLMARIQTPGSTTPAPARASWWGTKRNWRPTPGWGLAGLLLILVLVASNVLLWQRLNRLAVAIGPGGMRAIPLSSTGLVPQATGFIVISPDGRNGAVIVAGLPPLEPERQYQLWLIRDEERTNGAVFSVDQDGYGGARISAPELLFAYSAVGITIEPAGGSPGPTGDKVLGGPLD
jgi:anti-sigma-K factor RskA